MIFKSKSDNILCTIIINRLKKFISLKDVCNYIGIQVPDLAKIKNIKSTNQFKKEEDRDLNYHLGKIRYFIDNGIDRPIDIDCLSFNGKEYPIPVILDGRHRYIAALLRRDEEIKATYSGKKDLIEYLCGVTNNVPI